MRHIRATLRATLREIYGQLPVQFTPFTGNLLAITGNLRIITGNLRAITGNLRATNHCGRMIHCGRNWGGGRAAGAAKGCGLRKLLGNKTKVFERCKENMKDRRRRCWHKPGTLQLRPGEIHIHPSSG
eukprot:gene15300-biopygen9706